MATDNVAPTFSPPARSGDRSTVVVRRRLIAVAMVLAAVTVVVGHLLNVPATLPAADFVARVEAHRTGFLLGGLLQAAAAFLLLPSAGGVAALIPSRGAGWATAGTALTGIGAAATGAGLVTITTMMAMLAGSDRQLTSRVYDLAGHSPIGGLPFLLAPAMLVGLVLLGIALWRAGTVHKAGPIVLIVGAVLAGLAPGGGTAGAVGHLPLAAVLIYLATVLWSRASRP